MPRDSELVIFLLLIGTAALVASHGLSANSITAAATIDGLFVAIATMAAESSNNRISLAADLTMRLEDRFNGDDMRALRVKAARALLQKTRTEEHYREAEPVLDFFEMLGLLVQRGAVDQEFAYHIFFHWFHAYWIATKDYVEQKNGENPTDYDNLISLGKRFINIEKKKNGGKYPQLSPENLDKFLKEEVFDNQR